MPNKEIVADESSYIQELNKYKYFIIFTKILLILLIFSFLGATLKMQLEDTFNCFLFFIAIFVVISIFYFSFINNQDERKKIIAIWRFYFPIVFIFLMVIYSINIRQQNIELEYYKSKINYSAETKMKDTDIVFKRYEDKVKEYIYVLDKIGNGSQTDVNSDINRLFYVKLSMGVLISVTLFMFLWCLVELDFSKLKIKRFSRT